MSHDGYDKRQRWVGVHSHWDMCGQEPGVHFGAPWDLPVQRDSRLEDVDIMTATYNAQSVTITHFTGASSEAEIQDDRPRTSGVPTTQQWLCIIGTDWKLVEALGREYNLHPIVLEHLGRESIRHTDWHDQIMVKSYGNQIYFQLPMICDDWTRVYFDYLTDGRCHRLLYDENGAKRCTAVRNHAVYNLRGVATLDGTLITTSQDPKRLGYLLNNIFMRLQYDGTILRNSAVDVLVVAIVDMAVDLLEGVIRTYEAEMTSLDPSHLTEFGILALLRELLRSLTWVRRSVDGLLSICRAIRDGQTCPANSSHASLLAPTWKPDSSGQAGTFFSDTAKAYSDYTLDKLNEYKSRLSALEDQYNKTWQLALAVVERPPTRPLPREERATPQHHPAPVPTSSAVGAPIPTSLAKEAPTPRTNDVIYEEEEAATEPAPKMAPPPAIVISPAVDGGENAPADNTDSEPRTPGLRKRRLSPSGHDAGSGGDEGTESRSPGLGLQRLKLN